MSVNKRVVIVGANYAGSTLATALLKSKAVDVTVIDKRDFFENSLATPKMVITSGKPLVDIALRSHSEHLAGATFIQGAAESVSAEGVKVGEQVIPYDFLVIATGAHYPVWKDHTAITKDARSAELIAKYEEVKASKSLLVVGGGVVGIELASEYAALNPSKSVTLVTSSTKLLQPLAVDATHAKLAKKLEKLGVKVVYSERVSADAQPGEVTSEKGTALGTFDLILRSVGGFKPHSDFLKGSFLEPAINEAGFIQIEPTLLVKDQKTIFAIGDVATHATVPTRTSKHAAVANDQAAAAAKSILALVKDPAAKLKPFGTMEMTGFTVGPKDAIVIKDATGKTAPMGFLVRKLKGDTWFTGMMTKAAGFKAPAKK